MNVYEVLYRDTQLNGEKISLADIQSPNSLTRVVRNIRETGGIYITDPLEFIPWQCILKIRLLQTIS